MRVELFLLGVLRMPKQPRDPSIWVAVPVGERVIERPGIKRAWATGGSTARRWRGEPEDTLRV